MIERFDVNEDYAHTGIIKAGDFYYLGYCAGNIGGTIEEQINGAFDQMEYRLKMVGLSLVNVIQMDCLFRDVWNIPVMEKVIKERFNGKYPVRKSIQTNFAHQGGEKGLLFQVDGIAYAWEDKHMEFWDLYDVDRKLTGRTIARGQKMKDDEYHLVVTAWILNREGEWLITKRSANKSKPLKWEAPGGSVLAGEDSRQGVYREIKEEIGIDLSGGELFKSFRRDKVSWENPGFLDVWIFQMDFDLSDVVLQDEEVCDVKWASADEIIKMMENDEFVPMKEFPYYKEIFREYNI